MERPSGNDTRAPGDRRRRRYSVWTLLAPAAAVALYIGFFSALSGSCLVKGCDSKPNEARASSPDQADKVNEQPRNARTKVKAGDTLGLIAAKYDLTEEELKACNPEVDPQTLQPGAFLLISGERCEDADKAPVGADPDPLAGDTSAGPAAGSTPGTGGTPDTRNNGTAAADPSTRNADAGDAAGNDSAEAAGADTADG